MIDKMLWHGQTRTFELFGLVSIKSASDWVMIDNGLFSHLFFNSWIDGVSIFKTFINFYFFIVNRHASHMQASWTQVLSRVITWMHTLTNKAIYEIVYLWSKNMEKVCMKCILFYLFQHTTLFTGNPNETLSKITYTTWTL